MEVPNKKGMYRVKGSSDEGKRVSSLDEAMRLMSEPVPPIDLDTDTARTAQVADCPAKKHEASYVDPRENPTVESLNEMMREICEEVVDNLEDDQREIGVLRQQSSAHRSLPKIILTRSDLTMEVRSVGITGTSQQEDIEPEDLTSSE